MKPLSRDAHRPLMHAMRTIIGAGGGTEMVETLLDRQSPVGTAAPLLLVESLGYEPWASATFVGQTHWLEVRLEGDCAALEQACQRLDAQLREAEIPVPGSIVADIAIQASPIVARAGQASVCSLRLEVLTIDD